MPWNQATQEEYKRNRQELETTLTDDECVLLTFFPCHFASKGGGQGRNSNEGWKRWEARCG